MENNKNEYLSKILINSLAFLNVSKIVEQNGCRIPYATLSSNKVLIYRKKKKTKKRQNKKQKTKKQNTPQNKQINKQTIKLLFK